MLEIIYGLKIIIYLPCDKEKTIYSNNKRLEITGQLRVILLWAYRPCSCAKANVEG